tara:strand:- start:988 stop:1275 length:288 start_codon:yes stop_codon:yes gene_type:complete
LHGFLEKIGNLSWVGPAYADQGWVELTDAEKQNLRQAGLLARLDAEKNVALETLSNPAITLGDKIIWEEYLAALDVVCLSPDFYCDPKFPQRPNA